MSGKNSRKRMEKAEESSSSSSDGMAVECTSGREEPPVTKRRRVSKEDKRYYGEDSSESSSDSSDSSNTAIVSEVYQFKVTLKESKPRIWRRIQVPGNYNFRQLHEAIQAAMGWENEHTHQFQMLPRINPAIGYPSSESEESDESEEGSEKGSDQSDMFSWFDMFSETKTKTVYDTKVGISRFLGRAIYSYGSKFSWLHTVQLEKILPAIAGTSYPRCITGKGACPPEEMCYYCMDDYKELLAILANPSHMEYEERMEYLGGNFDPAKFDPKAVEFHDAKILVAKGKKNLKKNCIK